MTTASWWLLALAALLALSDWVAVSGLFPSLAKLEYAAKPGTVLALMAVAASLGTPDPARRAWFVVALTFCLIGDLLLMVPGERNATFGGGLGSFLVAQVCFIVGLTQSGGGWEIALGALGVLAVVAFIPGLVVVRALGKGETRLLVGPVLVYLTVLLAMAATAWSAGFGASPLGANPLVAAGGLVFVLSDTLLALNRFVRRLPRATLLVHVTYHAALFLLVLSLAGVAASR
jgi:uncharacterized membrane protein YhhN